MKLIKENITKEITNPKVIKRLVGDGWTTDEIKAPVAQPVMIEPIKRGRPAKKEK